MSSSPAARQFPTFDTVIAQHLADGVLEKVNDTLFTVSNVAMHASATVRILPGRALVEFVPESSIPRNVPSSLVLRDQLEKYGYAFYASAEQLGEFLREMA